MRILLGVLCIYYASLLHAQQVGINTNQPDASAVLDVSATDKGFLLPRLSTAQRNAISNPAIGLQIFNTELECLQIYFSTGWKSITCACNTAPNAPSVITGPSLVCPGQQGIIYSCDSVPGATSYQWQIVGGAQVVSGSGTRNITVNFPNQSSQIILSVQAVNGCGNSVGISQNVTVQSLNLSLQSPSSISLNSPASFSASPAGLNIYQWSFQSGTPALASGNPVQSQWSLVGTYNVQLIAGNPGCMDTVAQNITVTNCPAGSQTFDFSGSIQTLSIPSCVNQITIEAWGAQGGNRGNYTGGLGAYMKGTFAVTPGSNLSLVVGEQPPINTTCCGSSGAGGGGGSFVWVTGQTNQPLIAAGGGGGAENSGLANGLPGLSGLNGGNAASPGGLGGLNGQGGGSHNNWYDGAGGAGWFSNGQNSSCGGNQVQGGRSLPSFAGGIDFCGGQGLYNRGGFGGGGGFHHGGGGGGGYSGGGGGSNNNDQPGGGGGSFNGGTNQTNQPGVRTGHGRVIITW